MVLCQDIRLDCFVIASLVENLIKVSTGSHMASSVTVKYMYMYAGVHGD